MRQVNTGATVALAHDVGDAPGQIRSSTTLPPESAGSGGATFGAVTAAVRRTQRREALADRVAGAAGGEGAAPAEGSPPSPAGGEGRAAGARARPSRPP